MDEITAPRQIDELDPVRAGAETEHTGRWTNWLVQFLRAMAVISILKGLYHWMNVCGFLDGADGGFEVHAMAWQTTTVFFAIIDLVAAVGLWLSAPWGAVVWLTASVSMIVVELFFPHIFGGTVITIIFELAVIGTYLLLAIQSAREQPE
jgi:hypothetical protein